MSGKVKFECKVCGQKLNRDAADLKKDCPKCFSKDPYAGPAAASSKPALDLSASSAMESSSGVCSKGGAHTYKFGKCSKCACAEGKLAKAFGEHANPGAVGSGQGCEGGKKHAYKFGKCKVCGKNEF